MSYTEDEIKSYCGYCKKQFPPEEYLCPVCGSNLVNYKPGIPSEEVLAQQKWEQHNRHFKGKIG